MQQKQSELLTAGKTMNWYNLISLLVALTGVSPFLRCVHGLQVRTVLL